MAAPIQHLLARMDGTYGEGGWSVALSRALAGVTAVQAAWQPGPDRHSIWQIANHLTFWKEICAGALERAPRRPGRIDNAATFGAPGDAADASGWQAAAHRLDAAQARLRAAVAELDESDLDRPLPGEQVPVGDLIAGLIEHDAYHAGQIMLLRQLQGDRI